MFINIRLFKLLLFSSEVNSIQSHDSDPSRIELPGGGFITRPGSESMPSPVAQLDEFATPGVSMLGTNSLAAIKIETIIKHKKY